MKELIFRDGRKIRIGNIYGIGRNYTLHAKEMGNSPEAAPMVFIKPSNAYVPNGSRIKLPDISNNVHHEVELVVVIGKEADNISADAAMDYIAGYAVGLDITLRDLQKEAKEKGKPWAIAKGFRHSAPVSAIIMADDVNPGDGIEISLEINGILRQKGNTLDMIFDVPNLVSYLSKIFGLLEGDLIFTGTPEGVGQIHPGDKLHASLGGLVELDVEIE